MSCSNYFGRSLGISALALLVSSAAHAAVSTADSVVQYTSGSDLPNSYWGAPYDQASGALGLPDPSINLASNGNPNIFDDDGIVTPFSAQYNPANIVAIAGTGGYIELHMSQPISTAGITLGVHTGAGLFDPTFSGANSNPTANYTNDRSATLMVSEDGITFYPVPGATEFNNPTNIYTDVDGPYTSDPGSNLANFAEPFTDDLSSFDGQDFAGTLGVLNGSAGGTWVDLSPVALADGISEVNYVAFQTTDGQTMFLDSVVGVPVPEPTMLGLLILPCLSRRRR
jgi:hypothetical protein